VGGRRGEVGFLGVNLLIKEGLVIRIAKNNGINEYKEGCRFVYKLQCRVLTK
jgi:hypothetical protein